MRHQGNAVTALQSTNGITPDQIYKLGVKALGWNNTTAAGVAVIAEDMKLLKRLQLAHTFSYATDWPNQYTALGRK